MMTCIHLTTVNNNTKINYLGILVLDLDLDLVLVILDLVCEVIKLITLIRVFVLSVYLSCNKSMFCVWNYANLMTH